MTMRTVSFYAFWAVVFAFLWKPVIRWIVLILVLTVGWGMIKGVHANVEAHGYANSVELSQLSLEHTVSEPFVNYSVQNNSDSVVGEIEITCVDGDGKESVNLLDIFVASGESGGGEFRNMDVSYDSVCHLSHAKAFAK